jgi:hypothetical protein
MRQRAQLLERAASTSPADVWPPIGAGVSADRLHRAVEKSPTAPVGPVPRLRCIERHQIGVPEYPRADGVRTPRRAITTDLVRPNRSQSPRRLRRREPGIRGVDFSKQLIEWRHPRRCRRISPRYRPRPRHLLTLDTRTARSTHDPPVRVRVRVRHRPSPRRSRSPADRADWSSCAPRRTACPDGRGEFSGGLLGPNSLARS